MAGQIFLHFPHCTPVVAGPQAIPPYKHRHFCPSCKKGGYGIEGMGGLDGEQIG